jgi:hypothetical protein
MALSWKRGSCFCLLLRYVCRCLRHETRAGLRVTCPIYLSDFNQIWIFSTDFCGSPQNQIPRKSVQWESKRAERRTDGQDEGNVRMRLKWVFWLMRFSCNLFHSVFSLRFPFGATASRVRLKRDDTRWRTRGEVKGKLANGVGSQYSHTTSEHGVSSITTADAHTSAASSRLNW